MQYTKMATVLSATPGYKMESAGADWAQIRWLNYCGAMVMLQSATVLVWRYLHWTSYGYWNQLSCTNGDMTNLPFARNPWQHGCWIKTACRLSAWQLIYHQPIQFWKLPGIGSLTALLAQQVKKVVAVELDEKLADELLERVSANNVEVISQDILKFWPNHYAKGYKLVSQYYRITWPGICCRYCQNQLIRRWWPYC